MTKLLAVTFFATFAASSALAQAYDPDIGSGNLRAMESPVVTILPPACETRRMQFEDAFGWRVRNVLVCCAQGRCTYRAY
jgi:hypothetical protein